jgi:hypothetical protein
MLPALLPAAAAVALHPCTQRETTKNYEQRTTNYKNDNENERSVDKWSPLSPIPTLAPSQPYSTLHIITITTHHVLLQQYYC